MGSGPGLELCGRDYGLIEGGAPPRGVFALRLAAFLEERGLPRIGDWRGEAYQVPRAATLQRRQERPEGRWLLVRSPRGLERGDLGVEALDMRAVVGNEGLHTGSPSLSSLPDYRTTASGKPLSQSPRLAHPVPVPP